MFKKLMASIGIGSAKVDLEVANPTVELGGVIEGVVHIKAGNIEQAVEKIYINLVMTSAHGSGDETKHYKKTVATVTAADKMLLKPGQTETIPVKINIPLDMPVSKGRTKYFLLTGLDIENALDPSDKDPITVLPNSYLKMLLEAVETLGFIEKPRSGDYNGKYQEFEYRPTTFMARELEEIELYPSAKEQELVVAIEIDKRNKGLLGALLDDLDLNERYVHLRLPYSEINSASQLADMLKETIEREYKKI